MFRKILVAHDGSEGARKAMTVAIDLARHYGAEIQIISVIEAFPPTFKGSECPYCFFVLRALHTTSS